MEPRPIDVKEWRDTRTFSNLKSPRISCHIYRNRYIILFLNNPVISSKEIFVSFKPTYGYGIQV
jgi:hypothetical protein